MSPLPHPDEDDVTLSTIARMAGVGRAAVANWLRRHGGLEASGGTTESPLFPRAAAEQWLRDLDKLPEPGPARARRSAAVTFTGGTTLTVHGPELRSPALPAGGGPGYEEFCGFIEPDQPGIPWPTASFRIEQPGGAPYEVTDAHVDISSHGGPMEFLMLTWPAEQRSALPAPTEPTEAQE
ncbi:hypothetical protein [Streptomyces anulatus]|uniref:hypothetical protein n=1 Tax=Streptomyces anulatus TaxID=1892 RepID=UPI0037DD5049|nr:hypothetical protein OHB50_39405 [Streptomyces anulatus]